LRSCASLVGSFWNFRFYLGYDYTADREFVSMHLGWI
jgi:hypothetical protein